MKKIDRNRYPPGRSLTKTTCRRVIAEIIFVSVVVFSIPESRADFFDEISGFDPLGGLFADSESCTSHNVFIENPKFPNDKSKAWKLKDGKTKTVTSDTPKDKWGWWCDDSYEFTRCRGKTKITFIGKWDGRDFKYKC